MARTRGEAGEVPVQVTSQDHFVIGYLTLLDAWDRDMDQRILAFNHLTPSLGDDLDLAEKEGDFLGRRVRRVRAVDRVGLDRLAKLRS